MKVRTWLFNNSLFVASFNPRTREGANHLLIQWVGNIKSFNPRTREGANVLAHHYLLVHRGFNPRTREGANFRIDYL